MSKILDIKQIIKRPLRDVKEYAKYLRYKNTISKNPMHDDIYIVEFPKSDITWLQHLLGNIELQLIGDNDTHVTFYNHHKYMPDIHQLKDSLINSKFHRQRPV